MFEPVLVKLEKSKPLGAHLSAARSEPRADRVWTVPTSSDSGRRLTADHNRYPLFPPPQPPPCAAIKGAPRRRAPSFCPLPSLMPHLCFSTCRADAYPCNPVHRAPPPPATLCPTAASSSSTPCRCTSMTLPAPAPAPTTPPTPHHHGQPAPTSLRLS
jgi:hypothetical protein